jgi:hypothetical protein
MLEWSLPNPRVRLLFDPQLNGGLLQHDATGGECTDSRCPYRHDILRCEPCGRSLPAPLLKRHQKGKDHLRNVASNPPTNPGTPRPHPPAQPSSSNHPQFTLRADAPESPISRDDSGTFTTNANPRLSVSGGEGVHDFVTEGTGTIANPTFPPINQTILVENTSSSSNLSVQSMKLVPSPSPWCESFGDRIQFLTLLLVAFLRAYLARRC